VSDESTKPEIRTISLTDTVNSLTGFEEAKIEDHFGTPFGHLNSLNKMKRALIFIDRVRADDKAKPADVYKSVMELRLVDLHAHFLDDDKDADDFDPDEPDTEQGKDDSSSD
jgi:hypothetical protein